MVGWRPAMTASRWVLISLEKTAKVFPPTNHGNWFKKFLAWSENLASSNRLSIISSWSFTCCQRVPFCWCTKKNWLQAPHSLLERDLLPFPSLPSVHRFGERSHVRMSCRPDPLLVYAHRLKVRTQSLRQLSGVWKKMFPLHCLRDCLEFSTRVALLVFYRKKSFNRFPPDTFTADTKKHFEIVFPSMFAFLSPFSESQFMFERGRDWSAEILSTILFCTRDRSRERKRRTFSSANQFFLSTKNKGEVRNWETETTMKKRFLLLYR